MMVDGDNPGRRRLATMPSWLIDRVDKQACAYFAALGACYLSHTPLHDVFNRYRWYGYVNVALPAGRALVLLLILDHLSSTRSSET